MAQVQRLKPPTRLRPPGAFDRIPVFGFRNREVAAIGFDAIRIHRALSSKDDRVVLGMALQLAPMVPDVGAVLDCEEVCRPELAPMAVRA